MKPSKREYSQFLIIDDDPGIAKFLVTYLRQRGHTCQALTDGFQTAAWLGEHDLRDAVELMGAKPLLIAHARGDEQIPYGQSAELFERAAEPRKLILVAGGHHRSVQHDAELQEVALRWMERALPPG